MRLKNLIDALEVRGYKGHLIKEKAKYIKKNRQEIYIKNTGQKIKVKDKWHTRIIFIEENQELNLEKYLDKGNEYLCMGVNTIFKNGNKFSCPDICAKILEDRGVSCKKETKFKADHTNLEIPEDVYFKKILFNFKENNMDIGSLWTYLLARLYQYRINDLVWKLCNCKEDTTKAKTIYLESPLYPSREQTNRYAKPDLSVGCLKINKGSKRQLESDGEWICVAEMKWLDELIQPDDGIHNKNSNLPHINQFAKLIEHALLLHDMNGIFPKRVYVNLITPRYFKNNCNNFKEKNYKNIYYKYKNDKVGLLEDLKKCSIDFKNPDHNDAVLKKRVDDLTLNWITFEELLGLNDLVSNDNQKNEPKTNRDSWRQVFNEMNRINLIEEFLS